MCDPIGMIGLAFSIGSQVMQWQAQQDVMNKQQQANNEWLAYQRMKARRFDETQEQMRKKADIARVGTLNELTGEKQAAAQEEEQGRLEEEMMPTAEPGAHQTNDMRAQLFGEGAGNKITQHYADSLADATREARTRMQNLAVVASTTGSQFGLANRANSLLGESKDEIQLQGDLRQGNLLAYNVAKAVEPVKYAIGSGAGAAGGIGQAAAGLAGRSLGAAAAGGSQSF
jgi:hypothetical protein